MYETMLTNEGHCLTLDLQLNKIPLTPSSLLTLSKNYRQAFNTDS